MKYWRLISSEDSMNIDISQHEDMELIRKRYDGQPIRDIWREIPVETVKKGRKKDFPDFMGGLWFYAPRLYLFCKIF